MPPPFDPKPHRRQTVSQTSTSDIRHTSDKRDQKTGLLLLDTLNPQDAICSLSSPSSWLSGRIFARSPSPVASFPTRNSNQPEQQTYLLYLPPERVKMIQLLYRFFQFHYFYTSIQHLGLLHYYSTYIPGLMHCK